MAENASEGTVKCPVCTRGFEGGKINAHLDECLQTHDKPCQDAFDHETPAPPSKKPRTNTTDTRPAALFTLFHNKSKGADHKHKVESKVTCTDTAEVKVMDKPKCPDAAAASAKSTSKALMLNNQKPLAEILRPSTLDEYFGQNKLIGEQTLLRSLLQSQEIPSLILWGPPGCGKVSGLYLTFFFLMICPNVLFEVCKTVNSVLFLLCLSPQELNYTIVFHLYPTLHITALCKAHTVW